MIKRTKLKDIAEALNISVTTVSRAINSKSDISEETRKAVLAMADKLNYRPNALAISLRKSSFNVIGVILPSVDHYFFSTVLKGIMNKAHQANYLVMIGESMNDLERENEILNQFMSHCVTGILISPSGRDSLSQVRPKRIPFVVVDRPLENEVDSVVKYDDLNGAFLAVDHLINQGYKNIACLKGNKDCVISSTRLKGYKKALKLHDIESKANMIKSCTYPSKKDGYLMSKELLLATNKIDAFFTITDNLAAGVYEAAEELKLKIPTDLGVVGYSNSQISSSLTPKLTTIEQPGERMGEQAFDYLQQIIIGNNRLFKKTFDAQLIIRNSSAKNLPAYSA